MIDLDWGKDWAPLEDGSGIQAELDRELHPKHPLHAARPRAVGRCMLCDDVVAIVAKDLGDTELAVIHLTWSGRSEKPARDGTAWPYFERMTRDDFINRFLRRGEHL